MSNARDKANIPALNFSSTGIDDNATSTAITIDSSERVGIGSTAPGTDAGANADSLVIKKASGNVGMSIITDGSSNANIFLGDTSDNLNGLIQFNDSTNELRVGTTDGGGDLVLRSGANVEALRITDTGNVGIGTSSPSSALDVSGGLTVDGNNNIIEHKLTRQTAATAESRAVIKLTAKNPTSDVSDNFGSAIQFRMKDNTADTELGAIGFIRDGADGSGAFVVGQDSNTLHSTPQFIVKSNGNVGIGETSPLGLLHVQTAGTGATSVSGNANELVIESTGNVGITLQSDNSGTGNLYFGDVANGSVGRVSYDHSSNFMSFNTNASERMRIDSSGVVLVSKTDTTRGVAGVELRNDGFIRGERANAVAEFNRLSSDGIIIDLRQAGTQEGTISVSGATVSYNGFTGTHWSRFTDNSTPTILRGTVLESLDEMCDWYNLEFDVTTQDEDGNDVITTKKVPHVLTDSQSVGDVITYNHEGTDVQATIVKEADIKHMKSKVSDTVDAKNVYGVFINYDNDGEGYNDFYVASVGSFVVRIKANETIAKGDLLQSNGDGTAKVQTDDAVRSSSFAKVLSTTVIETYEDGSYLVPCSLMC